MLRIGLRGVPKATLIPNAVLVRVPATIHDHAPTAIHDHVPPSFAIMLLPSFAFYPTFLPPFWLSPWSPCQIPTTQHCSTEGKTSAKTTLPATPHTKAATGSSHHQDRPGPSSLAKVVQESSSESSDEEQPEEALEQVQPKNEVSFWRHVGKSYAMRYETRLPRSSLRVACWCESQMIQRAG